MKRLIKVKRSRLSGLILGLTILIHSCKPDPDVPVQVTTKASVQQLIDSGDLLNSYSLINENYELIFEKETFRIPEKEVSRIVTNPGNWVTTLSYVDGTELHIPSKGGDLAFIVDNINPNPSGYNPLAAKVEVALPTYGRIRVTVLGKNGPSGNITHLLSSTTPKQSVPVFGLYPDHNNTVELAFTDNAGNVRGATKINIKTEALPANFPHVYLVKSQPEKMEPGLNLVSYMGESELDVSMPYMIDSEGAVRWILLLKKSPDLNPFSASIGLHRTQKGTFIAGDQAIPRIVEMDMFGNLLQQWDLKTAGYTFHHEVMEAKNGNFLVTVTKEGATLANGKPRINDFIIELDPFNKNIVKEWDLATMIDTARYEKPDGITPPQFAQNPTNWVHNNSISEVGNDLLATMRYQGILSFTRTGKLKWLISPHKNWGEKYRPFLLNPIDENGNPVTHADAINGDVSVPGFDWSWGPHTPVVIGENRFIVFDNGYNRNWTHLTLREKNYSRIVEYKVDEVKKTVQQVWSFGEALGERGFSQALSGVQYLPKTKNMMFCPGMGVRTSSGLGGRVVEVNPLTKEVVFEAEITVSSMSAFHRVTRMAIYPDNL